MSQETASIHDIAETVVESVWRTPNRRNVDRFVDFTAREAEPDLKAVICDVLVAKIAATQDVAAPVDLNAVVLNPSFQIENRELVLIRGKNMGQAAVDALPELRRQLRPGDQVGLKSTQEHGVTVAHRIGPYPSTAIHRVDRVLADSGQIVVSDQTGAQNLLTMAEGLRGHPDLSAGASVFCADDVGIALAVDKPAQDERSLQLLRDVPRYSLADLGGQPEVNRQLKRMLAIMTSPPDSLVGYGLERSQKVVFAGPPGTGKTYAALIVASILEQAGFDVAILLVKGPEFLNPYVGASEAALRGFFEKLRYLADRHEMVYVIWDEFEALFHARGSHLSNTLVDDTMVPSLLAELDGLQKGALRNIWLIAISNRQDLLDPAVTRQGRLGHKVVFTTLPSEPAVREVAAIHLRGRKLAPDLDPHVASERMAAYAFSGGPNGCGLPVALIRMHDGRREVVTGRDVLTGAMVKGAIDRAAEHAWWRAHSGGPQGITLPDLFMGLEQVVTALPLSRNNLGEYLGWPVDEMARVVEVRGVNGAGHAA